MAFPSFLFHRFVSDKDATYLFLTNPLWRRLPAHGAATAALSAPIPTRTCHQDTKCPGWPGLWAGAVHLGGITRYFDVMLLTKTKIQIEAYSHNRLIYNVTFLTAFL